MASSAGSSDDEAAVESGEVILKGL
jgi:hypothetical protein